jgi:hypothetical protein
MFVPLKNVINSLLFLSIQDIKRIQKKLYNFKQDVIHNDSSAIKSVVGFIVDQIKSNKEEIIKAGINKLLDNEIIEKIMDVATKKEAKTARQFFGFLRKKPEFDLQGISNSKEGSKIKKFFNRRELANSNFVETYSRYLALILALNTSDQDYKQLEIATKIFNDYMYTNDCSTKLKIDNSLLPKPSENADNNNIYNGKLIIEFANGYTISVSQTGKLTHILPNLISGLFTDLYKYITTELANPDNELIHKFKSQLLDFNNFNRKDNLCKISLLSASNYLYPLYNMFYRTLLNLYVPINFEGQVIENSEDLIMSNPKLSSYESGSNLPNNIWDEDTQFEQASTGSKSIRQLAINKTMRKIRNTTSAPSQNKQSSDKESTKASRKSSEYHRSSNKASRKSSEYHRSSNKETVKHTQHSVSKNSNKETKESPILKLQRKASYNAATQPVKISPLKRNESYKQALNTK